MNARRFEMSPFLRALGAHTPVGCGLVLRGLPLKRPVEAVGDDPMAVFNNRPRQRRLTRGEDDGWIVDDDRPMDRPRTLVTINPHSFSGPTPEPLGYSVLVVDVDSDENVRAVTRLGDAGAPPSILVASGRPGHQHAYWLLDRLVPIDRGEPLARRLIGFANADPNFSAAHAAPIPAPGNLNPKTMMPVTLLELHDDRRYEPEAIDRALTTVGAPPYIAAHEPVASKRHRRNDSSYLDPMRADAGRVATLIDGLAPEWSARLAHGTRPGDGWGNGDRSVACVSMIRVFLGLGATEDEIAAIWCQYPDGIGARLEERGLADLQRQIGYVDQRRDREEGAPDLVEVHGVVARGAAVKLELEVTTGPAEGSRWWQSVARGSGVEPYVRAALGLAPGQSLDGSKLIRREARVVLGRWGGRPNVMKWLPP